MRSRSSSRIRRTARLELVGGPRTLLFRIFGTAPRPADRCSTTRSPTATRPTTESRVPDSTGTAARGHRRPRPRHLFERSGPHRPNRLRTVAVVPRGGDDHDIGVQAVQRRHEHQRRLVVIGETPERQVEHVDAEVGEPDDLLRHRPGVGLPSSPSTRRAATVAPGACCRISPSRRQHVRRCRAAIASGCRTAPPDSRRDPLFSNSAVSATPTRTPAPGYDTAARGVPSDSSGSPLPPKPICAGRPPAPTSGSSRCWG